MLCVDPADYAINKLLRVAEAHPNPEIQEDCEAFSVQVDRVYGMIESTFGVALQQVRKEDNLNEIAAVWHGMSGLCDRALKVLSSLKGQFPDCGTPEVHDRVLDYKNECAAKLQRVEEEITCQDQIPTTLFR